jgi:hypothetical protein
MLEARCRYRTSARGKSNRLGRNPVSSIYYSAAWTECSCLITCWHHHRTVSEAVACIRSAGGYVVAVHAGVMRSLTVAEEAEFQSVVRHPGHTPAVETAPLPSEAAVDSGYAVMTRIRAGDRWTWTTCMRFGTYADAVAQAQEGNKVVRFRSPEWTALRQQAEAASPIVRNAPPERLPRRRKGETLVGFVLRFLSAHGFNQDPEPSSYVKHGSINPAGVRPIHSQKENELISDSHAQESVIRTPADMIDLVLNRLDELETSELARMYAEDKHALLEAMGNRFRILLSLKAGVTDGRRHD